MGNSSLPKPRLKPGERIAAHYIYRDAEGNPVILKYRIERPDPESPKGYSKRFLQYSRNGNDWELGLDHAPEWRPLYRLPELLANKQAPIVFHEGEKCVELAVKTGLRGVHTTTLQSRGLDKVDFRPCRGREVFLVPDNDPTGRKWVAEIIEQLAKAGAAVVRLVRLPVPEKGDVEQWLAAGGTPAQWQKLLANAEPFTPPERTEKTETGWEEPVPLAQIETPPGLDLAAMPAELAEIVGTVAEGMQAPVELAWGIAMAVLATAIGKRAQVELPTHTEPSALWTCCVLPPGTRKSAVFRFFTDPLAEIEAEMQEAWSEEWRRWKAEAELAEARIQAIKAKMRSGNGDRKALALELAEERKVLDDEPVKPLLFVTDVTTEALRRALHDHGSIGLLSAEGSSLLEGFGRYNGGNRGADMALFLAAHAGDMDRGARVSGTHGVRQALASIGITIQPDVLQSIGRDRLAQGRGLLDRFLFLVPPDPRGNRKYRPQRLPQAIKARWMRIVRQIMETKPQDLVPSVALDERAAEAWLRFAEEVERRQGPGEDLRPLSGFASKLAGQVARIALAYHFAQGRGVSDCIDAATMRQAIETGRVLIEHAKAARQMMGEDEIMARARLVLECLIRHKPKIVRPWEIARNGWGGCRNTEEARQVLAVLCRHNYCRRIETEREGRTGATPKDAYEVHPAVLSVFSDNSDAPTTEPARGHTPAEQADDWRSWPVTAEETIIEVAP